MTQVDSLTLDIGAKEAHLQVYDAGHYLQFVAFISGMQPIPFQMGPDGVWVGDGNEIVIQKLGSLIEWKDN